MSSSPAGLHSIDHLDRDIEITLVISEWNRDFTESLEVETKNFLESQGFMNIDIILVPGAFEIPGVVKKLLDDEDSLDRLIIALGVIIRGETVHFDIIAGESARGLMDLSIRYDTPLINGILTCEDEAQVRARIGPGYAISGLNLLATLHDLYE